jgi:hypothetical protein
MAFASGPSGAVLVGGVAYALGKWRMSQKAGLPKVNNFTSPYQQLVAGLWSGTITVEGPYNAGSMPMAAGTSYALTLRFTAGVDLTCATAYCESIDPSQDIEDAARITITFQTSGAFTYSVT